MPLPLQMILHSILQHVISPQPGHGDEVNHLDLAIWNLILKGRAINVGYTILKYMIYTPNMANDPLPFGSIIIGN